MSHGVVHFEIPGDDPDKQGSFYTDSFDWKIQKVPMEDMEYWPRSLCSRTPRIAPRCSRAAPSYTWPPRLRR